MNGEARQRQISPKHRPASAAESARVLMTLPVPGPGRDTKYRTEFAEQARKLCLLGFTDAELASFFGVCEKTINNWKAQFPAFLHSITAGKEVADAEVAESLYRRATGETVIFEKAVKRDDGTYEAMKLSQFVPGEVQAQRLWLLNRRKANWRDKVELTGDPESPVFLEVRRTIIPAA